MVALSTANGAVFTKEGVLSPAWTTFTARREFAVTDTPKLVD
jgi:hypothetical protein